MMVIGLAATAGAAQGSLPIATLSAIKEATVMIVTSAEDDPGATQSGSGFLIRAEGQTGYVVTNDHVVSLPRDVSDTPPRIQVVLRSGTPRRHEVPAELVATAADPDLAILKLAGIPELPTPIDLLKEAELVETRPVYSFGFPFGEALAAGRGNPAVVVNTGTLSSVRRAADGRPSTVLINGALNPGNCEGTRR